MRAGIIGCGNISDTYFNSENIYNNIKIISCADIDNNLSKKTDGKSIWMNFIINSISLLKKNGYLVMITPSIWMKRDHKIFYFIRSHGEILKLHTLTNTETNKIFNKQAQTPTCFWLFQKNNNKNHVNVWDEINSNYILFQRNLSLPLKYPSIISKILLFVDKKPGRIKAITAIKKIADIICSVSI